MGGIKKPTVVTVRCLHTGHLCGTDTHMVGAGCQCLPCRAFFEGGQCTLDAESSAAGASTIKRPDITAAIYRGARAAGITHKLHLRDRDFRLIAEAVQDEIAHALNATTAASRQTSEVDWRSKAITRKRELRRLNKAIETWHRVADLAVQREINVRAELRRLRAFNATAAHEDEFGPVDLSDVEPDDIRGSKSDDRHAATLDYIAARMGSMTHHSEALRDGWPGLLRQAALAIREMTKQGLTENMRSHFDRLAASVSANESSDMLDHFQAGEVEIRDENGRTLEPFSLETPGDRLVINVMAHEPLCWTKTPPTGRRGEKP